MSSKSDFFLKELPVRAESRINRAVLICAFLKAFEGKPTCSTKDVRAYFEQAHLAQPSVSVLSYLFASYQRVSIRSGVVRSLVKGDDFIKEVYPEFFHENADLIPKISNMTRILLSQTPFIDSGYLDDLDNMLELYAILHALENSMRRLIEKALKEKLGADWWEKAASHSQKKKHEDRLEKELTRKWLPSRSALGPLYSLDWSDLITLMRKYEADFKPIVGEIDFLHRFADLGLLRHVVAHHGFVDNPRDFERVRLALHDWQNQIGSTLS